MTERIFYTISGSIRDNLNLTLNEAFDLLYDIMINISNSDHLKITIQGPNGEEVIKA